MGCGSVAAAERRSIRSGEILIDASKPKVETFSPRFNQSAENLVAHARQHS